MGLIFSPLERIWCSIWLSQKTPGLIICTIRLTSKELIPLFKLYLGGGGAGGHGRLWNNGSVVKNPPANAEVGDTSSIPGSGRSLGGGNGNSLQYSCLKTPMVRGVWRLQSMGSTKSRTRLSNWSNTHCFGMDWLSLVGATVSLGWDEDFQEKKKSSG